MSEIKFTDINLRFSTREDYSLSGQFKLEPEDFRVDEIPAYEFSEEGEHLILHIRQRGFQTLDAIHEISDRLQINSREVGYAGKKDKQAITTQYISLQLGRTQESSTILEKLKDLECCEILKWHRHKNKIKLGHLRGNRFTIQLKEIDSFEKCHTLFEQILEEGLLNYYGPQRVKNLEREWESGVKLLKKKGRLKEKERFKVNTIQSALFNLMLHEDKSENELLPLFGEKTPEHFIQDQKLKETLTHFELTPLDFKNQFGDLRKKRIFPEEMKFRKIDETTLELSFILPAGSYATVFIREFFKKSDSKELELLLFEPQ